MSNSSNSILPSSALTTLGGTTISALADVAKTRLTHPDPYQGGSCVRCCL